MNSSMAAGMTSISDPSTVCCDANIVIRFVTEPSATYVQELWAEWNRTRSVVIAPWLLRFEATNAIHRIANRDKFGLSQAQAVLTAPLNVPIRFVDRIDMHARALELSREFNLPAAYDAHYLALSELEGDRRFTSDQRLYNSARYSCPWITLVE
jgi:predicted nucleic acid-binding protein